MQAASKEVAAAEAGIPYAITRGDGSTGGGGLPMPKQQQLIDREHQQLKRPKVGAEMPHGRPSWFKVPAPSQGTYCILLVFTILYSFLLLARC